MKKDVGRAILAAALYAVSTPFSKVLLADVPPMMMAALLYLGAGGGMLLFGVIRGKAGRGGKKGRLTRRELPYTVGMVALDIAAPIFLMLGLSMTTAANASLLNNFEIVATTAVALAVFHEPVSGRLWAGVACITFSCMLLSVEDAASFAFSPGSLFVLLACVCWGFENNCTRKLSEKDPLQVVVVKGFGSGAGSLAIAFAAGERLAVLRLTLAALILGFVAYGLSIFFYVAAQRGLGAARTSAYYAVSPFIGAAVSFLVFRQRPSPLFLAALAVMAAGAVLATEPRRESGA